MQKFDLGRDLGITIARRKPREWTQDFVPVKRVQNGVVVIEDDRGKTRFIKILEINAVNFAIMAPEEQDRLIMTYMRQLRTGPDSFQIKIVTKRSNIEEYIAAAKKALSEEQDINCKTMIVNYINYLSREASAQTFKKHYYYIFEYEPPAYGKGASSESEAIAALNRKADEIISNFKSLGNKVKITRPEEQDWELCNILYDYYNRKICSYENFESRLDRIEHDVKAINGIPQDEEAPDDSDFKSILAPKSIDFNESPNYMVIDGQYRCHYFAPGRNIPSYINTAGGWLTELTSFGEGFDVDLFFKKVDSAQKLNSIRNSLKFKRNDMEQTTAEDMNADEVMEGYSSAMFMKTALKSGGEEIYEMSVMMTTHADTLEELLDRKEFIKKRSIEMDMPLWECKRFQEEAFSSTGFFLDLSPKLFNLTHRNITSSGVAACYPYTAFSLADPEGIAVGYHRENKSLIMVDPFATHYANANISLYGSSGQGKTFTLMTLTSRMRFQGVQQYILSPDKQDEFRRICSAIGGVFVDISPSSTQRINLFEISPMESPERSLLGGDSYIEKSWLVDKIDSIKIWCNYLIKDLTYAEKVTIGRVLTELYADFGITEDNSSVYEDPVKKTVKRMPIMSDFYERIRREKGLRPDIGIILSQFVTGEAKSLNGHTNVDLNNKYIVFGLENIKGELLAPSMFIILDYVWGKCRERKTEKKMISIDEGWKLLDPKNPLVGEFVQEIFKIIRGYGGGAIFATQSIVDLFRDGSNFGNAILSCSHSKIILGMEQKDLKLITGELGLSATESAQIMGSEPGEALMCAGANHIPVKIQASDLEYKLFTTRRSDLAEIIKESQARKEI